MFGATKTPETFVLQNNGAGAFVLKYRGAIDDNPQVAREVTVTVTPSEPPSTAAT